MRFLKGSKLILLLCFLDAFLFTWWYYNGTLFWVASGLGLIYAVVTFVNNKREDCVYSMGHRNRRRPRHKHDGDHPRPRLKTGEVFRGLNEKEGSGSKSYLDPENSFA